MLAPSRVVLDLWFFFLFPLGILKYSCTFTRSSRHWMLYCPLLSAVQLQWRNCVSRANANEMLKDSSAGSTYKWLARHEMRTTQSCNDVKVFFFFFTLIQNLDVTRRFHFFFNPGADQFTHLPLDGAAFSNAIFCKLVLKEHFFPRFLHVSTACGVCEVHDSHKVFQRQFHCDARVPKCVFLTFEKD